MQFILVSTHREILLLPAIHISLSIQSNCYSDYSKMSLCVECRLFYDIYSSSLLSSFRRILFFLCFVLVQLSPHHINLLHSFDFVFISSKCTNMAHATANNNKIGGIERIKGNAKKKQELVSICALCI